MKKIFTLALLAIITLTSNAATRKWDFTKWSAATVANLQLGAGQVSPSSNWSDIEKATATAPSATSANNCFWQVEVQAAGTTLQANGQDIAETAGLLFTNTSSRSLAIAVNYPTADVSSVAQTYHGPSYLWLGSKNINYFTIPNVKAGSTIKIGIESHKNTEARGVQLFIGSNSGTQLKAPDGTDVATPTVYEDQIFQVPADEITDTPNEDGTYNIVVRNTNGCHLYYITVEEGGSAEEDKNVAWVSGDFDNDLAYAFKPATGFVYTEIPSTAAITTDSLRTFDAVVISPNVTSDAPMAKLLEENIAYVPMINLNSSLFGYGPLVGITNSRLTAADKDNEIFTGVEIDESNQFEYAPVGITLPERFQSDDVLATNGDIVAFHQHTSKRNSYILIPTNDNVDFNGSWNSIMINAISMVAATKKAVTATATPTISLAYANGSTTATISCSTTGSKIQYAIGDGAYQDYTEPITFSEAATIKAKATAEGYTESAEATSAVDIKTQAAAPTINVDGETFTISGEGTVYYNVTGSNSTANSAVYTEPVIAPYSCTVTAFTTVDGKLQSEAVSQTVSVSNPWQKELAHVSFGEGYVKKDGVTAVTKSTLNKKFPYIMYNDSLGYDDPAYAALPTIEITITDEEGVQTQKTVHVNDSVNTYSHIEDGNTWVVETRGANMAFSTDYNAGICTDGGSFAYGSADPFSAKLFTKNAFTFGELNHTRDAEYVKPSVTSGQTYQAPFKLTALMTGALGSGTCQSHAYAIDGNVVTQRMEFCVSTDAENWTVVDTLCTTTDKMYEAKSIMYNGTDNVYVKLRAIMQDGNSASSNRKINLSDVYIFAQGEADAIKSVVANTTQNTSVRKYIHNGQVLIQTPRGTFTTSGQLYSK